jgi:hypothetical protein
MVYLEMLSVLQNNFGDGDKTENNQFQSRFELATPGIEAKL